MEQYISSETFNTFETCDDSNVIANDEILFVKIKLMITNETA